ncbi:MAG: SWIM zinc finger family protein [Bacteroidales bacterium]|nr:SWIM zinc finger family protein [Bacteroidales bacterium]
MARGFGLTWWGERWLDSLTKIDYANRIPRGAAYARNGSVREVVFSAGGAIKAKVQGRRPSPYRIEITVPQFPQKGKESFISKLSSHPSILSRLMNRELPEEVLQIAQECSLKVFPSSWKDLGMKCSCPDWAVPCKHIAAVIYKISQEIDNDPFLVFKMHGLDILSEVENAGVLLDSSVVMDVGSTAGRIVPFSGKFTPVEWEADYSLLPDLSSTLPQILEESSSFDENFREKYSSSLRRCIRNLSRRSSSDNAASFSEITPSSVLSVRFSDDLSWTPFIADFSSKGEEMEPSSLIESLRRWEGEDTSLLMSSSLAFFRIFRAATFLVKSGCIVPQIYSLPSGKYRIIWGPAVMDSAVSALVEGIGKSTDPSIAFLSKNKKAKGVENASLLILEAFITYLVCENSEPSYDKIMDFLFRCKAESFSGIGEKGIPGGIKSALSCFHIASSGYKPFLKADDTGEGFSVEFGFEVKGRDVAMRNILSRKTYEEDRFKMLQQFSLLFRHVREASHYVDSGAKEPIFFSDYEFSGFLTDIVPVVRLLSVRVILPKGLQTLLRPRPALKISRKGDSGKTFIRAEDLLDFSWEVAIGDEFLSAEEFDALLGKARGLIRFKGSFFYVDEADLSKIGKAMAMVKGPGKMRLLQAALSGEYEGTAVHLSDEAKTLIESLTSVGDVPLPEGINARMRPYQERGYSWMYKNFRLGFGSIIADDMGLGKTLQVIALLGKLKEEGAFAKKKCLIVVPTGLLSNWESEFDRFAPFISHRRYHGPARSMEGFTEDVLLTSYGVLRSDSEILSKKKWEVMVIDEAQNIKNTTTAQTKAAKSIPSECRIAMSGTPVENRLSEYWSIMDFVNKGYLDTQKNFKLSYADPIQLKGDKACAEKFRKVTAPFMMRRLKTDKSIISDLPDKVNRNFSPSLTPSQAALYRQVVEEYMAVLEGMDPGEGGTLFKREGIVLQMILALKQICDHPSLFLKDGHSEESLSGKCGMLCDLVESIVESGEKVLVFTQFKEMGDILESVLSERLGHKPLFYHGGCTLKKRTEMVERFQNVKSENVFILSLKAAGTGLNLTAASHVIHFDLWWNPAVEAQATDRAYRIGQHKNVLVTRFVTKGTFEEKIDKMIESKKELADLTVSSGESWIGKLSDKQLRELFG